MHPNVPERWPEAAPDLLPVLRGTWAPAGSWRADSPLLRRAVAPFLTELVAWDTPRLRRLVQQRHVARWGVPAAQVFAEAAAHLPETTGLTREGPLWRLSAGDGYESSRLLLPGWLAAFGPGAVAAVPCSRTLCVADGDDLTALEALLTLAGSGFARGAEPISPALYVTGPTGALRPWAPPPDHPLAAGQRQAQRALQMKAYAAQDEALAEQGIPHAPVTLLSPDDPRLSCVLRPGVWLPEVEVVQVDGARVPWSEVQPTLERVEGVAPARWVWRGR
ncbi:MAG: hypothetical protein H6739_10895 [Alphaproteobacteria bacterium]|nr:hypothetical protein [Alphaproteobacteria bacterium]